MSIMDRFSMRGKVSVVTGGNRGIGRAIARGLAEAGSAIAIAARDEKQTADTVEELRRLGIEAIGMRTDVTDREDLEAMAEEVGRALGPIDVLVNNAGIGMHANALTLADDEWERLFATNLEGVWKASQIVGRRMVSNAAARSSTSDRSPA